MNKQAFEISTLNYESDRRIIENIIKKVEWGLHDKSGLEISEPSKYLGWTFFTISIDVKFIAKMAEVYESLLHAKGWVYYEKFEDWLNAKLDEAGSKARAKTYAPEFELF